MMMFVPWGASVAGTEPNLDLMPTIHINNHDVVKPGFNEAWITTVAKLADQSKQMEGCSVEEPILPVLVATLMRQ